MMPQKSSANVENYSEQAAAVFQLPLTVCNFVAETQAVICCVAKSP